MYYDYSKIKSYNGFLNFIIGSRGVGKTYGAKKMVVSDFLKNKKQFIYLRRYKTELNTSATTFFDDLINNHEFDGVEFSVKKNKNFFEFKINGEIAGFGIALSTSIILKSTSFPEVSTIIFDEFIIDKGVYHYLQDEVVKFLDLIETIGRLRNIKVYLLGNAISIINPYFTYWNLSTPYGNEFKRLKDGLIIIHCPKNEEYECAKKNSRFGKLIEGTEYGDYAISNKWLRDDKTFIEKRSTNSIYWGMIIINGENIGVWRNFEKGIVYLDKHYNVNTKLKLACSVEDHQQNTILASINSNPILKLILIAYKNGHLRFSSLKIKSKMMKLINKYYHL